MGILRQLGMQDVINAVGPATRLGGSALDAEVVAAMADAASSYVPMDLLERRAGAVIAQITGAQDGYVVSGAAAGLTLATAACLAGLDIDAMERLPQTDGLRHRILILSTHRYSYDHAVRAAGATLHDIEPAALHGGGLVDEAEDAAGFLYNASGLASGPALADVVRAVQPLAVPVIVDAAAAVPPVENLRAFIADGADIVAFSGGKAIGGPSASGFLAGRADLILSASLQHQDMDVRAPTWGYRDAMARGAITALPGQGIGRGMKVGKEEIAGLLVALQRYDTRDHETDQRDWERRVAVIVGALAGQAGVTARRAIQDITGPVPHAIIDVEPAVTNLTGDDVLLALSTGDPPIYLGEHDADRHSLTFCPSNVSDEQTAIVARRLVEIVARHYPDR